jgi:hypothetical protein
MNDLPDPSVVSGVSPADSQQQTVHPSGAKELEPVAAKADGMRDATGQETVLAPEVSGAGVKVRPGVIPINPRVAQMGVKPAGQNIPVQTTPTVVLPLTDQQIEVGLHQGITDSMRWLAVWCVRKLKQAHIALRNIHGSVLRTRT